MYMCYKNFRACLPFRPRDYPKHKGDDFTVFFFFFKEVTERFDACIEKFKDVNWYTKLHSQRKNYIL